MEQIYYDLSEAPVHIDKNRTDSTQKPAEVRPSCFNGSFSAIMVDYPQGFTWKEHQHGPEQITICFKGKMSYTVNGETHILEPGDTIYVPAWAMHTGVALTDVQAMDVFTPGRKDHQAWFDDSIEYKCEFEEKKD